MWKHPECAEHIIDLIEEGLTLYIVVWSE